MSTKSLETNGKRRAAKVDKTLELVLVAADGCLGPVQTVRD
jgi:hypothetical protein